MSKHNHNHDHCCHDTIKYCAHCDVTYCVSCSKEWGAKKWTYTPYTWPNTWTTTGSVTVYNTETDVRDSIASVIEKNTGHTHT